MKSRSRSVSSNLMRVYLFLVSDLVNRLNSKVLDNVQNLELIKQISGGGGSAGSGAMDTIKQI